MSENQSFEGQNNIIEYKNIMYSINEEENTAGVIGCKKIDQKILIPRSMKIGTKEYYVTSILPRAFKYLEIQFIQFESNSNLQIIDEEAFSYSQIKKITIPSSVTCIGKYAFADCQQLRQIRIPKDSKLQTIEEYAFSCSTIENITIPSELVDLKESWCYKTSNLTRIKVSPNNPRYSLFKSKMIIGKTRIEQNNHDCLVFCVRDIKHIKIPDFIEHICSFSFHDCDQLESIEIPYDSKLQTIDKYAFSRTAIKNITISSSVIYIGESAFFLCKDF